jgi:esterase/lipase
MKYDRHLLIIVPVSGLNDANKALAEAYGCTGNQFTIPLSKTGRLPATHFACGVPGSEGHELSLSRLLKKSTVKWCHLSEDGLDSKATKHSLKVIGE